MIIICYNTIMNSRTIILLGRSGGLPPEWLGRRDIKIILIDITEDEAITRLLKRARADDTENSIRSRLQWFNTEAAPALDYFEKSGRLIKINGLGAVEDVFDRIKQALGI